MDNLMDKDSASLELGVFRRNWKLFLQEDCLKFTVQAKRSTVSLRATDSWPRPSADTI